MKQILHIFAKDTRRFWPEILISLALTVAFVCLAPYLWNEAGAERANTLKAIAGLLEVLIPVSWWILLSRLFHAERLVGDTQFWITRPYTRHGLLAAKTLFLLVFLYLPFFLAQCILLAKAGFSVSAHLPGLLFVLLLASCFIVLPLVALATITSNFARMTLTILGIVLGAIALLILSSWLLATQVRGGVYMHSLMDFYLCLALALLGLCAIITVQYAWRKLWLTRTLLLALPFLLIGTVWLAVQYDQTQIDRIYPATTQLLQLAYNAGAVPRGTSTYRNTAKQAPVVLHLTTSGVAAGNLFSTEGVQVEITAPNGSHWKSSWQTFTRDRILPGENPLDVYVQLPFAVLSKYQSTPLRLRLNLAFARGQEDTSFTAALSEQEFTVPGFGICGAEKTDDPSDPIEGIHCRTALRKPELTNVVTRWSGGTCPNAPDPAKQGPLGELWIGDLEQMPATFSITPVQHPPFGFSNDTTGGEENKHRTLCPDTPIHFTTYRLAGRAQTSLVIDNYRLPQLSIKGDSVTFVQ